MNNIFLIAGLIAVIFLMYKFVEMRFIEKETKPLKYLIKDTIIVYICVVTCYYIIEQFPSNVLDSGISVQPAAFTDNPPF